jgi:hypothetical protein
MEAELQSGFFERKSFNHGWTQMNTDLEYRKKGRARYSVAATPRRNEGTTTPARRGVVTTFAPSAPFYGHSLLEIGLCLFP